LTTSITLKNAREIIRGALAYREATDLKPLAIVVLDTGGHVVACEREDGAANKRFEIAYGKAHGAISFGVNSRVLETMAMERPYFINGATAAIGGGLVPVAGGLIVVQRDRPMGAVGASGDTSDNDEAAVIAGILAAGLQHLAT
jgi:uncharacterized protein GlcG (DUF336 family)